MSKQKFYCEACGQIIENTQMITTVFGTHYHIDCVTDHDESDVITAV